VDIFPFCCVDNFGKFASAWLGSANLDRYLLQAEFPGEVAPSWMKN